MSWFSRFPQRVFVETGTFRGDNIQAVLDDFDEIHSIELDMNLANAVWKRFAGEPKVDIWCGDSAKILPILCADIDEPVCFYLDSHWSGWGPETPLPLLKELQAIATRPYADTVVIDDMRLMGKKSWSGEDGTDWPRAEFDFREATVEEILKACPGREEWAQDIDRLIIWRHP